MKKIDFDIIPLALAVLLILFSLIIVTSSDYILSLKNYIGIGCVLVSIYLYFKKRMIYYLFFGLTLLIGVFGIVGFYYSSIQVGFGNFGINPIMTGLLVMHLALVFQIAEKMDT